jgi:hypothetical protein
VAEVALGEVGVALEGEPRARGDGLGRHLGAAEVGGEQP